MIPEPVVERSRVTRSAVVDAALGLLAEGGLEAVSFRRIARALGVAGPTLYWHVENKRQLMDLMAEELVRRAGRAYAGPEPGQPWWEWLRADAQRMFAALIATRDAPRVLGVLVDAGLTAGEAQQALFAIGAYVIGSATEWQAEAEREATQPRPHPGNEELNALRARILSGRPHLLAAIGELLERPRSAAFEFGLDLLVQGLRSRYASEE